MNELTQTWRSVREWVRNHPFWVDLAGTVPLFLLMAPTAFVFGTGGNPILNFVLSAGLVWPLAIRRTRPALSAALIYSTGLVLLLIGQWELVPAALAVPIALHSVTLHGPRWAYITALLGGFAGIVWWTLGTAAVASPSPYPREQAVTALFMVFSSSTFLISVWAFALVRRSRREKMEALMDRAAQLEIERDQQHRIATAAERTRIAREMHDIVAHSLSVIIAQADGGRYAAKQDHDAAERVLGTIAETGRDALADMRRLLGVLRPPTPQAGQVAGAPPAASVPGTAGPTYAGRPEHAGGEARGQDRTPQPASGDLDTLISQTRASGLRVSFVRMGTARPLPPGMGLAVYRICQESLTNILKHAGPDPTVTVLLRWDAETLILDVNDDGRGAAADTDGAGQGLLGMGERATMFGGTLTSGPRPGGGFRVHLELPIPPPGNDPPMAGTFSPPNRGENL